MLWTYGESSMTPAEANKKWCPFAKSRYVDGSSLSGPQVAAHFGPDPMALTTACIAANCMAWRWDTGPDGFSSETHGHCGLAGNIR